MNFINPLKGYGEISGRAIEIIQQEQEEKEQEQYEISERRHRETLKVANMSLCISFIALIAALMGVFIALI